MARNKFYFIFGVGWDCLCGIVVSNGPWLTWLSMEHGGTTVDKGRASHGKQFVQYQVVQYKPHMICRGTEPRPRWREAGNYLSDILDRRQLCTSFCKRTYHIFLLVDNCCALVVPKCALNLCQIHRGIVVVKYPSRYNGPMIKTQHIVTH